MVKSSNIAQQRQEKILSYIKNYMYNNGYPPSVREIGSAVGLSSSSTVHKYLHQLEQLGKINRYSNKPRTIVVRSNMSPVANINIPLIGTVTAGAPILAYENIEEVYSLPQNLVGYTADMFMLHISGDSMINAGIFDGDIVIVKQQNSADNGDIVVALINDEIATVKRLLYINGRIILKPENDNMASIIEYDVKILGKVIGLYRQL